MAVVITFCEFMKRALSDPGTGYYTRRAGIGFAGADFATAPEISPAFASLLALQIQEMDRTLSHPDPFYLIEAGPGNGTLASDLLTIFREADRDLFQRIAPVFYELPGVLAEEQKKRLSRFPLTHSPLWVHPGPEGGSGTGPVPGTGVLFGNEFLDALPVHRVRVSQGAWEEAYVEEAGGGRFRETWGALSSPDLFRKLAGMISPEDLTRLEGLETEVSLAIPSVLDVLDRFLTWGFMLWIDYGDIARERHSLRRGRGTLLSYREQKVTEDLLSAPPGESDLTAFVDFSQVAGHLDSLGYRLEGYTDQMSWLMGLGFEDWITLNQDRLSSREIEDAGVLIHPARMGRTFKVLAMSRGVGASGAGEGVQGPLTGFRFGGLRSPLEGE